MTAIYLARMDSTLATAATILSMADATGASLLKYGVGTSGGAVYTRSGTTNTTHSSSLSTNQLVVVAQIFRYTNPFTWMEVWVNGYQVYNEVVTDQASLSIQNMVLGSGKSATATYNAGWGGAIGGLYVTNDNYLTNNAWLAMQKLRAAAGI
jgi:hypothetical protein